MQCSIAGVVGGGASCVSEHHCRSILGGLSQFGSDPVVLDSEPASFGALRARGSTPSDESPSSLGRLLCVVDGRIDNFRELQRRLGFQRDSSPASALAHAWLKWGPDTPRYLIGEYAFALFDSSRRRLWLARDPSGYRPLFYHVANGTISFASMPSGLLAVHPGRPHLAHFARDLAGLPCEEESSYWTGIRHIPPGTIVSFFEGRSSEASILSVGQVRDGRGSWHDLVDEMRLRLDCAVRRNLVGSGSTVAAQLSSGLDSSAVAATAARHIAGRKALIALTAAPTEQARLLVRRGRFPDESALAAETARAAGAEHIVIREQLPLFAAVRGIAQFFQQPAPAQFSFPWWRAMSELVRERSGSIILTGGQGNATLSYGGLAALARYLSQGRVGDWWREARCASVREEVRLRGVLYNSFYPLMPDWLSERLFRKANGIPRAARSYVRPEWRPRAHVEPDRSSGYMADRLAMIRNFDAGTRKRAMHALSGVEERDPTADRELIEFALSLPPDAHLKEGRAKPLIRDALADRIPEAVLNNRQRGVCGADWYDRIGPTDCRDAMDDIQASPSASELLDIEAIGRAIDNWPRFNPAHVAPLSDFGARIARALSTGLFLAETDRYPLGRADRQ